MNNNIKSLIDISDFKENFNTSLKYSQILLDIEHIVFSTENIICKIDDSTDNNLKLLGFHQLENGLSFLGCKSNKHLEGPIYFIIYSDGKQLRGYIPSEGNTYNYVFGTAFGREDSTKITKISKEEIKIINDMYYENITFDNLTVIIKHMLRNNIGCVKRKYTNINNDIILDNIKQNTINLISL